MALIKIISSDGAQGIYDVDIPVIVTNVLTTGVSYAITDAGGAAPLDITIPAGTVTMTGASYIRNMNDEIEKTVADPYVIPAFHTTYRIGSNEPHVIATQGVT